MMCPATELSTVANPGGVLVASGARCHRKAAVAPLLRAPLYLPTVELSDRLASTSNLCAVIACVRRIGTSTLVVALSIRRVIRAIFARWAGILAPSNARPQSFSSPEVERTNAVD
jgi:hypothetical protein